MSRDTFLYFRGGSDAMSGGTAPSIEELVQIVKDYTGSEKVEVDTTKKLPWICCVLPGKPAYPFKCLQGTILPENYSMAEVYEEQDERWFEIFVHGEMETLAGKRCKMIDVLTRQQDKYTNAVAQGLVELLAGFFRARVEK